MPNSIGTTTTQDFAEPAFALADVTARGDAAKGLGATSYKITDNGDSFTLDITWPPSDSVAAGGDDDRAVTPI